MFEKLSQLLASLLILAILFPSLVFAQASQSNGGSASSQSTPGALATGAHPLGSYGGSSFDQVNLFNGNLSMSFPLAALGGRAGSGAGISLSYNSKIWKVEHKVVSAREVGTDYYVPVYEHWDKEKPILAPGWNFHVGRMMGRYSSWKDQPTNINYTLTTLTFSSPDGTEYSFRDDLTNGQPLVTNSIGNSQSRGKRFHTADGTAAIFVSDTDIIDQYQTGVQLPFAANGVVVLRNGTRFIISRGKVKEQHDSNGNIVRYAYQGSRLTQITDTLGRQINIQYIDANSTNNELFRINITSPGFSNTTRTTSIKFASLANALVGQGGSYSQAETLKTYTNQPGIAGLFPDLDAPNSNNELFNPTIIKEITLPSGHKWNFRYNSYGEVVLVETPNLGAIEYRMEQSSGPIIAGSINKQEIFRRMSARRVWPRATDRTANLAPESKTTYGDPSLTDNNHIPIPVRQRTFSGENTRIASSNHYYNSSPLDNFTPGTGVPPKTGYSPWMEGKEIKTEELTLDSEQPKRITEYTWEQRAGISWIAGADKTFLAQPENDPRIKETKVRYLDSGQVFSTAYEYQDNVFINGVGPFGYNNVISESVFDGGSLLRKNVRTFVTDAEYLKYNDDPANRDIVINPHLVSLVNRESVLNPNGIEETRVEYEYDNYSRDGLVGRTFSVATSHNNNYETSFIKRGNVTAVTAGLGSSTTQTDRTTGFSQYDIAGNVIKTTGPKSNQIVRTDYDTQHFAFPIASRQSIPEFFQEFRTESSYDVSTGLVTSTKDFNNQVVNYFYQDPDLLDRITRVQRPSGSGETRYTYSSPGIYPAFVKVDTSLDNGRDLSATSYVDGFLKPIQQTSKDVNNGSVSVETIYDGLGRGVKTINPHRLSTSATTDGYTKTTYDELGRVLSVSTFDSNNVSTGTVTSFYGGTIIIVTDQVGKQRRSKVDALGRLTEVIEPNASGSFSQPTTYDYDARGNLKQVNQGGQTRTFSYDSLGRLLTSSSPETGANGNGTTFYEYDIASNLTKRIDPRAIVTFYAYDTLNRLLTRGYSDTTPTASYFYDGNLPSGLTPPNFSSQFSIGRVSAVVTATTARQQATGLFHTYDSVGRITKSVQLLDGQYYTTNSQYNLASLPTSHTYPSGRSINHSYNIAGQLTDVISNNVAISGQATYTAAGAIESHKLGNNLFHKVKYNSRLQPTQITLGSVFNPEDKWKLEYNYTAYNTQNLINSNSPPFVPNDQSQNNGNIGSISITPGLGNNPIQQFFGYDELNRLKVAKEFVITPPFFYNDLNWVELYTYDRYGNRAQVEGTNPQTLSISSSTNRINSSGYTYDNAGNLIADPSTGQFYKYDAENRLITASFNPFTVVVPDYEYYYDASGCRVKKVLDPVTTRFIYDQGGTLLAEYEADSFNTPPPSSPTKENIYAPSGLLAVIEANQISYLTPDHLGSTRVITDSTGIVTSRTDFYPFGQAIANTSIFGRTSSNGYPSLPDFVRQKFTGYEKDDEIGLDFAQARHFSSSLGRFMQADPLGASGRPRNPQTWNRYAYVLNKPTTLMDPTGLIDFGGLKGFAKGIAKGAKKLITGPYYLGKALFTNPGATTTTIAHGVVQGARDAGAAARQISLDPFGTLSGTVDILVTFEEEEIFEVVGDALVDAGVLVGTSGFGAEAEAASGAAKIAEGAAELSRLGKPVSSIERTLEHALNPQSYIDDIVSKYSINLRGSGTKIDAIYDSSLPVGQFGVTRASEGGKVIRIGRDALTDEATTANTLAHELSHGRDYLRGTHKPHGNASSIGNKTPYGSGNALEQYIKGNK